MRFANLFRKAQPTRTQVAVQVAKNLGALGLVGGAVGAGATVGSRIADAACNRSEKYVGLVAAAIEDGWQNIRNRFSKKPATKAQAAA